VIKLVKISIEDVTACHISKLSNPAPTVTPSSDPSCAYTAR